MKTRRAVLFSLLLSGCYTTKVYTPAPASGPELQDRQWFTIGGLVPLSEPTGEKCPGGLARAESKFGIVDILINVGLGVAGGVAGAAICNNASEDDQRACSFAGASLVPFLIASRTVEYACAGSKPAASAAAATVAGNDAAELNAPKQPLR